MAARVQKYHSEQVRLKIKGTQLVNMLSSVALSGKAPNGETVGPERIQAAKILLGKYMPDLSAVTMSSDSDAVLGVIVVPGKGK